MAVKILFKHLIIISLTAFLGAIASAEELDASAEKATTGADTSAVTATAIELPKNVQPRPNAGHNFYLFANHSWVSEVEIPADSLSAGALNEARERTEAEIARIEADLLARTWPEGSAEHQYQIFYHAFLDERRVNRRGLKPIRDSLQRIRLAQSHHDIAAFMGNNWPYAGGLFDISLKVSQQEGRAYIPKLGLARPLFGLSEIYLRDDAHAIALRAQGADMLEQLLRRGSGRFGVRKRVQAVMALETQLARLAPDANAERDPARSQPLLLAGELAELAPDFPWTHYLRAHGLAADTRLSLAPFDDLGAIADIFARTPVAVWRDYLSLRLMIRYGAYLSEDVAIMTESLGQLRAATLRPLPSRAERASDFAQWMVPNVLARQYVERHLTEETVRSVEAMAEEIRAAYRRRLENADWLSRQTRIAALEKLECLAFMIGVPPDWHTSSTVPGADGDVFSAVFQKFRTRHVSTLARYHEHPPGGMRDVATLRQNISFSPLQVGAYYLPRLNMIVLPAAYLQPPFFDPEADIAENYGALGTTLGHEIGHAFDDQGSQFDPTGAFENWWTPKDRARFDQLAADLSAQFTGFDAAPGVPLDPQLTLGENFSDLAGIETARDAMLAAGARQETPMDDATRRAMLQRFFLSYAGKRRRVRRPETDRQFAPRDRHSPPDLRTNIILSNIDAWYDAFEIHQTDAFYRTPQDRLTIWPAPD